MKFSLRFTSSMELVMCGSWLLSEMNSHRVKRWHFGDPRKSFLITMVMKLPGPAYGPSVTIQGLCFQVEASSHLLHQQRCICWPYLWHANTGFSGFSLFDSPICKILGPCSAVAPGLCPALAADTGEDLERNDGSAEKPYFVTPSLHRILTKKHPVSQRQTE